MRAALFHQHGGPEVLRLEEVPTPEPAAGEVLVRVRAAALNHLDLWVRRGIGIETTMPHIGGSDIAGEVAALGTGVQAPAVGTRVVVNPSLWCGRCEFCARGEHSLCARFRILGEHTDGGFAEFVAVPAVKTYPIPDAIPFEVAAALPISYQTAWRALVTRAALRPGETVLVTGASGGTAIAAIQIARLAGARVYAVTSGAEKAARLARLGVEVVYDRLSEDFSRAVFRDTDKRGVDVVVESVGEPFWTSSLRSLVRGGRLVTFGATAGSNVSTDLRRVFWKQLQIIGSTMASRAEFEAMLRAAWGGALAPVIDRVMPLEEAGAAHQRLEEGAHFGKVVLLP